MRKLKLIWDFRGPTSTKTAEHHLVHLNEYIKENNPSITIIGVETLNDMHAFAYLVVDEKDMKSIRDVLKPNRGQVYQH